MTDFQRDGYEIISHLLDAERVNFLKQEIENYINAESIYGIRHLDKKVPAIAELANSSLVLDRLKIYTAENLSLVKATYFNKTPNNNWFVGWHQDKTISLKEKIETPGFINWTTKQGVVHVQPPLNIMQRIITVRLHLDRANLENGALQLIQASHHKILNAQAIASLAVSSKPVICEVDSGDALIMSPLVLHRSAKAKFNTAVNSSQHRAIVHLEYTHCKLFGNLQWV